MSPDKFASYKQLGRTIIFRTLIPTAAVLSVAPSAAAESINPLCPIQPITTNEFVQKPSERKANEVLVESDFVELIRKQTAEFSGNVVIFQENHTVAADQAIYNEALNQFLANGNVVLSAESAKVKGNSIFIDETNKDFKLQKAQYEFTFNGGRGSAQQFSIEGSKKLKLDEATFTTCPIQDPAWLFSSEDIYIDQDKGWGEAWNTVFKVADIPVVYIPYITFPISDARKTGLLFPEFGSSSKLGAYYAQPIYFNLQPNLDYTLTPKYMSDRGFMVKNNLRYMTANSMSEVQVDYLHSDDELPELNARHLTFAQHESNWSDNWNLQLQWTQLSDDSFINDFNSAYHHQADTHLNNFLNIGYYSENLDINVLSQDIAELGPHTQSYQVPIQISADWRAAKFDSGIYVDMFSQLTLFQHDNLDESQVTRAHVTPEFGYEFYSPGFQLETSFSYLSTHYRKEFESLNETENVSRGIGKYRLLTGLTFEKQGVYFGKPVRQTLEPKIQYLYVESADQTDIGLYDSQLLKEDYFALFRDNTYSGIDRIAAMNQATIGFSSSIFNQNNQELLRLGIGQVHKFEDNYLAPGTNEQQTSSKPALAVEFFGRISENWQVDGGFLYNRDTSEVDSGFVSLDYYLAADKNIQINHRFAKDVAGIKINQTGLFTSYKINNSWSMGASYHYDSERDVNLDSVIGFEYRSCCWSIQVSAQRQVQLDLLSDTPIDSDQMVYDNSIGINFRINGLGGDSSSAISSLFSDSIFAYRRPYLIAN